VAKGGEQKSDKIDPKWPGETYEHGHAVGEFTSDRQGSLSPFGDELLPLPQDKVPYTHPVTVINR
jgi:hypothetical protein